MRRDFFRGLLTKRTDCQLPEGFPHGLCGHAATGLPIAASGLTDGEEQRRAVFPSLGIKPALFPDISLQNSDALDRKLTGERAICQTKLASHEIILIQ
jgi:hypothetical protein